VAGNPDATVRYRITGQSLQKIKDYNALVIAKIFRLSLEEPKWQVRVLVDLDQKTSAHSLPFGQVMDVLIPHLIHTRQVEAVVPTWSKVKVQILKGRGLAAEDLNGKSDPYVYVLAGKNFRERTSIKKSTLAPVWDDALFEIDYSKDHTEIGFEVFDYDRIGKDEFLGRFNVTIAALPPNKEVTRWFTLKPRGREGEVSGEDLLGSLNVKLLKLAPTD